MAVRMQVPVETVQQLEPWYGTLPREVRVLRGSIFGWMFGIFGQHAVTINGTVHYTRHAPSLSEVRGITLLGHELFHVEQQRDMGWCRFLAAYLWHWRPKHIRRGWEHPYEVPAYDRGRAIRDTLESA